MNLERRPSALPANVKTFGHSSSLFKWYDETIYKILLIKNPNVFTFSILSEPYLIPRRIKDIEVVSTANEIYPTSPCIVIITVK